MGNPKRKYASQKSKTPLYVVNATKSLASYIMVITGNEKSFPRAYRNVLCNLLRENALELYVMMSIATQLPFTPAESYEKIIKLHDGARDAFIAINALVSIAGGLTKLSNPEHLSKLITDVDASMTNWLHYVKRRKHRADVRAEMSPLELYEFDNEYRFRKLDAVAIQMEHDEDGFIKLIKHVEEPKPVKTEIQKEKKDKKAKKNAARDGYGNSKRNWFYQ